MIDFAQRSNGQGLRVMLLDGKPYYAFQEGGPGHWGLFSPLRACPLFGGLFANVSPRNDPGAFDNIGISVNDNDIATVQAFNSSALFGGADNTFWSTWEEAPGGQFRDWVRIP